MPWWVKFLWACSRQCRKTTDNLPMDRQCKKTNKQFTYGQTVQKNNRQFTYGQTVQKKTTNNLHMDRQCKKNNKQFTYGQTVQKNNSNLHMDSTYLQTVQRQCAKYTYIYSVHIVYYRDILNYQRHIIHRMGTSTLCTLSIHNVVCT